MYYYDVALGVEKHWDSALYTYSSEEPLEVGQVVRVSFGRQSKSGFVAKKSTKPSFAVKPVTTYANVRITKPTRDFIAWYQRYYAAKPGQAIAQALPHYLTKRTPKLTAIGKPKSARITLNKTQQSARKSLLATSKPSVLHGITGSGKTRLYLSLIQHTLESGQSALLLYPEISLTPQLLKEFKAHVPVLAFHSGMSDAERSKAWFAVATSQEPLLVIGPRSSLFLPHKDLGLIIVDEAHESTYKQETDIHYNGLLTAGGLAKAHSAKLIIGSATPPLYESELITRGGGDLVCMHEQAIESTHTKTIELIDRKNRTLFTRHPMLSDALLNSIASSLDAGKQSLLFINRRGTAKVTTCENCGWQSECTRCELPLTYHHDLYVMLCHTCGLKAAVLPTCPNCGHMTTLKSFGSKAMVQEIQQLFPEARIGRYDTDTEKADSFLENYDAIRGGSVDILIGTQQIAKGLDLPLLQTVGVLDADLSLHFPDFSAEERTFQLIAQVTGRVGRGHGNGHIVIQTLHPENATLALATTEDWHGFREKELISRHVHGFPPFVFAAKVIIRDKKLESGLLRGQKLAKALKTEDVKVDGPLPAFTPKRGGHYYVHIHLRSQSRASLLKAISSVQDDMIVDLDPNSML